ncbi:arginine biosynthesis bifunctional chloroplastic-like [Micractinium conductrix]|uniref:Arginine biosynthesis bifunctional protein ArgJ, chloroplastic n=1 Tax=Micractinium conductrix TaxID=554055 RepID=A0A2P6V6B5_9CHLO|nr:arginine biosynthesis bifunctional chloroplastic-like [Micractinium conductrix]|eukprot:PSC69634.1 arginine biosynthesis bifunctional chloroplastic-like [Micractinium conductrix]
MAALSACTVLALPAAAAADRRAPPLAARPHLAGCALPAAARSKSLRPRQTQARSVRVAAADIPGDFSIPAAPILIPAGPWKEIDGCVCAPKGFKAQGMYGGLRAKGTKADIALVVADEPAVAAGVFTLNVMCAAPVTYCKEVLAKQDKVRACLVNAGQANAATGELGYADSLASAEAVATALGVSPDDVLLQSTGVIGRRIKMEALLDAVPKLAATLGSGAEDAHRAAVAITTTDLVSKSAALEVELSPGRTVRLGGIAKGSGMIHPNMATMLSVVTCDAPVTPEVWRGMFKRGAVNSFNQITVDGDTSTNDTVIGLTSGAAGGAEISDTASPEAQRLQAALTALLQGLAKSIAWDGEGATVLIECEVLGAADDAAANKVAKSVVGSSLAKSAIFGHDPNWGRIAAAAGYSGVQYDQAAVRIQLGGMLLMDKGQPLEFDAKAASAYLRGRADVHGTVNIQVTIGDGPGRGMAWGCDLSYDYVKINAEYTT